MAVKYTNDALVKGDDFNLYLIELPSGGTISDWGTGEVLAYATSCSLQTDSETIDTTSKFSCKWQSALGGKASYTLSADALYTNLSGALSFETLLRYMVDGKNVGWVMGKEEKFDGLCEDNPHTLDTNETFYCGYAVVQSVSLEAGANEIATCSINLTGAGEILIKGESI
jgi:hypothetical protein